MFRVVTVPAGNAKQCFASADAGAWFVRGRGPRLGPIGVRELYYIPPRLFVTFFQSGLTNQTRFGVRSL
jgi:hypothetical protein